MVGHENFELFKILVEAKSPAKGGGGSSHKFMPGSVTVAHQNLGLTVEVRILTGQPLWTLIRTTMAGIINSYGVTRRF
jgi:hypothetical protein